MDEYLRIRQMIFAIPQYMMGNVHVTTGSIPFAVTIGGFFHVNLDLGQRCMTRIAAQNPIYLP